MDSNNVIDEYKRSPRKNNNTYKIKISNTDLSILQEAIGQASEAVKIAQVSMDSAVAQAVHVQTSHTTLLAALQTASIQALSAVGQATSVQAALKMALKSGQPEIQKSDDK